MIYLFMLIKTAAWGVAFWCGIQCGMKRMLLMAAVITVFLAVADHIVITGTIALPAVAVTLLLYGAMSFFLFPLAWKLRNPAVSAACSVMGTFGAFAVVHFANDFITSALAI